MQIDSGKKKTAYLKITGVKYPVNVFKGWSRTYCKNLQKQAMKLANENAKRWTTLFTKPLNKWTPHL